MNYDRTASRNRDGDEHSRFQKMSKSFSRVNDDDQKKLKDKWTSSWIGRDRRKAKG